jgi:uncharacterized membrane protein
MLVVVPVYLAFLLLLKGMKSVAAMVRPVAKLLPAGVHAELLLSLLLIAGICYLVGFAIGTRAGRNVLSSMEHSLFDKIPGYPLIRSLTLRVAGKSEGNAWRPALAEIEEALVPAFIVEELEDGRLTVFVPSVPTPFAGSLYILTPERVHPLNIPFTHAIQVISRWGSGSKDWVEAMERGPAETRRPAA